MKTEHEALLSEVDFDVSEYRARRSARGGRGAHAREGHSKEPPRHTLEILHRVGAMIETLILLENKGHSIGECASRYLAILKEWRVKACRRSCRNGKDASWLLKEIQRWIERGACDEEEEEEEELWF